MRLAPSIGSIAFHAVVLVAMLRMAQAPDPPYASRPTFELVDVAVEPPALATPIATRPSSGPAGGHAARRSARPTTSQEPTSPWGDVTIGEDTGNGVGRGTGNGFGTGTGIGFGEGGGVQKIRELPAVPAPFVSKARPATLIHPSREMEVDEAELFTARVTVDESGDVVGAHMMRSHPGSRGETASSMIWQFRYSPALDDDGAPVRSTFVQTFAVR